MMVGSLGDVVFSVSVDEVKNIKSLSWKIAAAYQTHKMHGKKALLEYTGLDAQEMDIECEVSASLGVNPMDMINELAAMLEGHEAVSLILGEEVIGESWVLKDMSISAERFWKDGTLLAATIKLKIQEYAEG